MTIRIWFTTEDLARTRVAGPDPLAETVFSLIPLRTGGLPGWSRTTLRRLAAPLRPLAGMFPVYPAPPASVGSAQLGQDRRTVPCPA